MSKEASDQSIRPPQAILVGIQLPKIPVAETDGSMQELRRLVDTLGFNVIGTFKQKRNAVSGGVVVGQGKLRELALWTGGPGVVSATFVAKKSKAAERFGQEDKEDSEELEETSEEEATPEEEIQGGPPPGVRADTIIFDCDLTPSQLRNLESATAAKVLDRTGVIIEIFSRHARTKIAKLQVEIARLNYLAPRLRETGGGDDRGGGGVGGKGSGESSQELDRRRIRDRIKELREELEAVQAESQVRRTKRSEENCVALVGYTNAGKSSLMRALTGSDILVADKLFATLDTTVRPLYPPSLPKVLISDTVGFIKKLPHDLVASFRSTLDEALNADLLLYVVDASDPTFRSQLEVTRDVIKEVGAHETPSRLILNKRDRLNAQELEALQKAFPDAILLSTRNASDLAELRSTLLGFFEQGMVDEDILVPFDVQGAVGEIRRQTRVLQESYNERGALLRVRAPADKLSQLRKRFSLS
jgi:GTP-binding protein HflX